MTTQLLPPFGPQVTPTPPPPMPPLDRVTFVSGTFTVRISESAPVDDEALRDLLGCLATNLTWANATATVEEFEMVELAITGKKESIGGLDYRH